MFYLLNFFQFILHPSTGNLKFKFVLLKKTEFNIITIIIQIWFISKNNSFNLIKNKLSKYMLKYVLFILVQLEAFFFLFVEKKVSFNHEWSILLKWFNELDWTHTIMLHQSIHFIISKKKLRKYILTFTC